MTPARDASWLHQLGANRHHLHYPYSARTLRMTVRPFPVRIGDRVTVTYDPWPVSTLRRAIAEVAHIGGRKNITLRLRFFDPKQQQKWGDVTFTADGRAQGWPTLSWVPGVAAAEHLQSDLIRAITSGLANLPADIPPGCRHDILQAVISTAQDLLHRLPPTPPPPPKPRTKRHYHRV